MSEQNVSQLGTQLAEEKKQAAVDSLFEAILGTIALLLGIVAFGIMFSYCLQALSKPTNRVSAYAGMACSVFAILVCILVIWAVWRSWNKESK